MIEAPETPHRHHGSQQWFDITIAVAVVLVSLGSLYVSLHTGKTMEQLVEQNARLVRANSVPLLQFGTGNVGPDGGSELFFEVKNVGTGPARIVWFEMQRQDGGLVRSFPDLLPKGSRLSRTGSGIVTGGIAPSMVPAGERRMLLSWPRPDHGVPGLAEWDRLNQERFGLKVEACYCSLFDECWLTKASADVPRRVASCDIGHRVTFQG